jgi:hypothetical protein
MSKGAQIVVASNKSLTGTGAIIKGCDFMWKSITVNSDALLVLQTCQISDGQYAVEALTGSFLVLTGNVFDKNNSGLYFNGGFVKTGFGINIIDNQFTCTEPLLPKYINTQANYGTRSFAGIHLNKANTIFIGTNDASTVRNKMIGMRHGIYIQQSNGCGIFGCDVNIFNGQPPAWTAECISGLYDRGSIGGIYNHHNFRYVGRGFDILNNTVPLAIVSNRVRSRLDCILVRNTNIMAFANGSSGVEISSNIYLNSFTASGIRFQNAVGTEGRINFTANNIVQPGSEAVSEATYGIYGIGVTGVPLGNNIRLTLTSNKVQLPSTIDQPGGPLSGGGIYIGNCQAQTTARDNEIISFEGKFPDPTEFGILVANSNNCQVVHNSVSGAFGNNNDLLLRKGLYASSANNTLFCDNTVNKSGDGIYVSMNNNMQDQISCNHLNWHNDALRYQTNGITGAQYCRGNTWTDLNNRDAFHPSPLIAQQSVYNLPLSTLGANPIVQVGGGMSGVGSWFKDNNCTSPGYFSCSSASGYCGELPYPLANAGDDEVTALDIEALQSTNDPELTVVRWVARQNLFAKLLRYPQLVNFNQEVANFFVAAQNGLIGQLQQIRQGIETVGNPPANIAVDYYAKIQQLSDNFTTVQSLLAQIAVATPAQLPALHAQLASVQQDISTLNTALEAYQAQINVEKANRITNLLTLNQSLTVAAGHEAHERNINTILLNALAADTWVFTASEKAVIDDIAARCPYQAGRGVYIARDLKDTYSLPNWSDDCPPPIAAKGAADRDNTNWTLAPNPASSTITITFAPTVTAVRYVLIDQAGRQVQSGTIPVGAEQQVLDVRQLANGIYFLEARDGISINTRHKVVVLK